MSDRTEAYRAVWKDTLEQIRAQVSDQEFAMWLSSVEYDTAEGDRISVIVPSSFHKDQIKQRYSALIEERLESAIGSRVTLDYRVRKKGAESDVTQPSAKDKPSIPRSERLHPSLNKDYTFNNFVIGDNNSFAANAAIAISKDPGKAYNPCLIYGGVGLGKTHLLQSIGNQAYRQFDKIKIMYVTAENFVNEFIMSIREKKTHTFKNKYRACDILLLDDIHDLQGKKETQEELFHTFNALYDAGKQMVFTCDRPVSEIRDISDRLRNRFERGLNVDLQPPSYETRYAILRAKIEKYTVPITDEILDLISKNITSNVRDLEAALTKLAAYSELVNKTITLETAIMQLKDMFSVSKQGNVTLEMIMRCAAEYFNLTPNDLKGKKRTQTIVFPRQVAMYVAREITEFSTTEIGLEFGGRDHTTVMHACQRVETKIKTDPTLEPTIQRIILSIKNTRTKP